MRQLNIFDKAGNKYTNEDLNFIVVEKTFPDLPTQNTIKEKVPYRRSEVVYRTEDEKRPLRLKIHFLVDNFGGLSESLNKLNAILKDEVMLQSEEIGYIYIARLVGEPSQETVSTHNKIYDLTFEISTPYKYGPNSLRELEFGQGFSFGMGLEFGQEPAIYTIQSPQTISLFNAGNETAKPIIRIVGTCDNITIGSLSYSQPIVDNLTIYSGYEDKYICYRNNAGIIENKLMNLSGDFIEIPAGESEITIDGTNLNVEFQIEYRHTYR